MKHFNEKYAFRYLLSFGSNLGDKQSHCKQGLREISRYVDIYHSSEWIITPCLKSDIYDTSSHEDYLNFVVEAASNLAPKELYLKIQAIEDHIGHSRASKWMPRQIDIDILFFAKNDHHEFGACSPASFKDHDLQLTIPHEEFWKRDFLCELTFNDLKISQEKLKNHNVHKSASV